MRKGHGSSKVPNVKLRPVAAGSSKLSSYSTKSTSWIPEIGDDDLSEIKKGSTKPFTGVVMCASGISDKPSIFSQAERLGAQTSSDLTDRVTHLIANGPGSAKYAYCVRHRISIMKPSWITESFKAWLNGDDVNFRTSLNEHRLPIFSSVRLCLTGIDAIEKRTRINKLLTRNGGLFIKDLDRNASVTYLLCGGEGGSDVDERGWTTKMLYAEKVNKKEDGKIHLVWEEWFWDCLEFGGLLDLEDYVVTRPRPKRRVCVESASPASALCSSRPYEALATPPPSSSTVSDSSLLSHRLPPSLPSTSLLNPTDAEEIVTIKRMPEVTVQLWEGLLKKRGFEVKNGMLVRSPSKSEGFRLGLAETASIQSASRLQARQTMQVDMSYSIADRNESSLSAFKRSKSFAAKDSSMSTSTSTLDFSKAPLNRTLSTPSSTNRTPNTLFASMSSDAMPSITGAPATSPFLAPIHEGRSISQTESTLFLGLKFRLLGEAKGPSVRKAVQACGGIVAQEFDEKVDFVIVRLSSGSNFLREEPDQQIWAKYRTECWVERCIYEERICLVNEHVSFSPLRVDAPIPGADNLLLHFSGLEPSEKCWALRLTRALGISITDKNFSRKNTHLLCPLGVGPKFDRAREWQTPVVTMEWLFEIARTGYVGPVVDFLVLIGGTSLPSVTESHEGDGQADEKMADITNGGSSQARSNEKAHRNSMEPDVSDMIPLSSQKAASLTEGSMNARVEAATSFGQVDVDILPSSKTISTRNSHKLNSSPIRPLNLQSVSASMPASPAKPSSKPKTNDISVAQLAIFGDIEQDIETTRIPSSNTPSPLKVSSIHQAQSHRMMSAESAKTLKDTITSLLGKRQASVEPDAPAQLSKAGKRARPTRSKSKPISTNSSITFPDDLISCARSPSPNASQYSAGLEAAGVVDPSGDESMRVMYEDPGQRDEKKRLLRLLGGEESVPAEPLPKVRSTRGKKGPNKNSRQPGY